MPIQYTHIKSTSCYRAANKLLQICSQAVDNYSCVRIVTSLEQDVIMSTTCHKLDGFIRLVTRLFCYKSDTVMHGITRTRLTTQSCNNIVIS
jgi:hypothetical protein